MTAQASRVALDAIDAFVSERAHALFALVIEYLREARDVRSTSEIETYFKRNFDVGGATIACEYLADQGIIGKAAMPVRLTKKSNVDLQELAFFHTVLRS